MLQQNVNCIFNIDIKSCCFFLKWRCCVASSNFSGKTSLEIRQIVNFHMEMSSLYPQSGPMVLRALASTDIHVAQNYSILFVVLHISN